MNDNALSRPSLRTRAAAVPGVLALLLLAIPAAPAAAGTHIAAAEADAVPDWRPVELGDGWPISTPEEQGLDSSVIQRMVEVAATDPRLDTIYSLLLVRHGTLVAEAYFNGRRPQQTNEVRSATKSVTSLLVGIAMDRGLLGSEDQTLYELLPDFRHLLAEPGKRGLTLRHALTMQLGLAWEENSPGYTWSEWPPDLVGFTLEQPVVEAPGTRFRYSSGSTQVLVAAVLEASGSELHTFAEEHLFGPLGIEGTTWMRHFRGYHYGGVGLYIRPRGMAKIGQLALQRGRWETAPGELRQVVSEDWIRRSTRDHVHQPVGYLGGYGYQWWVDPEDEVFSAIGHGGQWIAVFPAEDGVLVISADPTVRGNDSIDIDPLTDLLDGVELPEVPGRVAFPAGRFKAVEGEGRVSVPVRRLGGSDGAAKVIWEVAGGSARAGEDFLPSRGVLSWNHGEASPRHLEIALVDDGVEEGEETFEVRLQVLTGGIGLGRAAATVVVADDDAVRPPRPGRLRCQHATWAVTEGETAVITVLREGGADGEVSLRWATADRSAVAGEDFQAASGVLAWGDGEAGPKSFEVTALADGVAERSELFEVRLSDPAGGATLEPGGAAAVLAVTDADTAGGCAPGAEALCLGGGRFRVEVEWQDQRSGDRGFGFASPQTDETGTLWFFDAANVELVVKAVDGRPVNGAWWLFYGGLSDVEYWLVVTDTTSGAARVYHNRPGDLCGGADTRAFPEAAGVRSAPEASGAWELTGLSGEPASATAGACEPSAEALCLLGGRFRVEVTWRDPRSGSTGTGRVRPGGDQTGYFWFFHPANLELVVKTLDARPVNGRFWFFYGALSDVEYEITVTDTSTGARQRYRNEPGDLCGGSDTAAF